MPDLIPARRCPLCGEDNQCTGAIPSEPHQPCWCTTAEISKEALARLPEGNRVCICPRCGTGNSETFETTKDTKAHEGMQQGSDQVVAEIPNLG